jgi:putative MATE family efflux protein
MPWRLDLKSERLYILGEMPVRKAIIQLALPVVAAMVVQILYNLTDTFFVGMMNDPRQVAAVSLAMPVFMIITAIAGVFGNGGASFLSRLLGKHDFQSAKEVASASTALCVIGGTILGILSLVFMPSILHSIGTSPDTYEPTRRYMIYVMLGSPIIMCNFAISQLLRAEGATKINMMGMIIGTGTNIVLDPLFILGLQMGVAGAAIATVIGNGVALAYYIRYYRHSESLAAPSLKTLVFRGSVIREILGIGIPASLSQVMMSVGNAISNTMVARYDDYHVAAIGVGMRIISIPIFIFIGLAMGIQPLIGYCYGAGNRTRLKKVNREAMKMGLGLSIVFVLMFAFFSRPMIEVFMRDNRVVEPGILVLHAMIFAFPFAAMQMQFMISLQAMGKALASLIVALSRQGLAYIPSLFILNALFGFHGIVFSMPVADLITTVVAFILLRHHTHRMEHTAGAPKPLPNESEPSDKGGIPGR